MMDGTVFCTVITPDYMPFALTLHESLGEWHDDTRLVVLLAGERVALSGIAFPSRPGLSLLFADDLHGDPRDEEVHRKYFGRDMDAFRWSCKPGLMRHLLVKEGHERIAFCDPDILFTGNCEGILSSLADHRFLLTPHTTWIDPAADAKSHRLYRTGFFNAGFVAATAQAMPILDWWQTSCLTACVRTSRFGLYVDQRYLDVMPFLFDGIKVVDDPRCNLGGWRMDEFLSSRPAVWPLPPEQAPIFLHFTSIDKRVALPGPSESALQDYSERLRRNGLPYSFLERIKQKRATEAAEREALARQRGRFLTRVRGMLRLGTRYRHLAEAFGLRPGPLDPTE